MYRPQNESTMKRPQSSKVYGNYRTLAIKKFEQLDELMAEGLNHLKNEISNLKLEDYMAASKSLTRLYSAKDPYSKEMPIKILDSLIENEEHGNNGFSVYNRGQNLKQSLIDPKRVKEFVEQ